MSTPEQIGNSAGHSLYAQVVQPTPSPPTSLLGQLLAEKGSGDGRIGRASSSNSVDSDSTGIVKDVKRPLIFYQMELDQNTLRLVKFFSADVLISY